MMLLLQLRLLKDFAKTHKKLELKAGLVQGESMMKRK
jgi:ribosomal protein L10